jgi:ABC-type branched-subunit amino acid transport system ATPase component
MRLWLFPPLRCGVLISSKNFIGLVRIRTTFTQPALEAVLSLLIGHAGEEYIVVNGPNGAGKSSVVNRVIANQSFGVMSLSLQSSDTDINTIIANNICEQNQVWKINDAVHVLQESIQVIRKRPGLSDWVPTLIDSAGAGAGCAGRS